MLSSASPSAIATAQRVTTDIRQRPRRIVQNFVAIWLDADIDESKDEFRLSLKCLRDFVSIRSFTDTNECINFLDGIQIEKVFMIISDALGHRIVPDIHNKPQLDSIYIFGSNKSLHEEWTKEWSKVKGVHIQIESICSALQKDGKRCDQDSIPVTFDGIDASFMYTQLFKEVLLEIDDEDKSKPIEELVTYCRLQNDFSKLSIAKIEREYYDKTPSYWYTGPYFLYSMLNKALRDLDMEIILKMGFFIRHLHQHLQELHHEQSWPTTSFIVYRGQGLSITDFDKMKQTKGGLMSFNNFLSTSQDRDVSLEFARPALFDPDKIPILFVMTIDPSLCASTPFASLDKVSYYGNGEAEILLSTHTIFRIDQIKPIDDPSCRFWEVKLTLTGDNDNNLNQVTASLREELIGPTASSRLGDLLIKSGQSGKAEQLYQLLLEAAFNDKDRALYSNQLGLVYDNMGEYWKALSFHEKSLAIREKTLSQNHPDSAQSYSNIAMLYYNMGEYSKALSFNEKSLAIREKTLSQNHPDSAQSYNNIGMVYMNMGEYSKALSFKQKSLAIYEKIRPPNHPDLATIFNNIARTYYSMGEYLKALSFNEKSLPIFEKTLPPNHPFLAASYNNIAEVYHNIGDYSKALSFNEKSLAIKEKTLPPNHPLLATSYNNIGLVYMNMGEYSKALGLLEKSLKIREISLPPTHPDITDLRTSIETVRKEL